MSAIDPEVVGQLAAYLPPADFRRLIRTFEADLARLAREYDEVASRDDAPGQQRVAHGLAGAAAGIGALRLEAAARLAMEPAAGEASAAHAARIRRETEAALAGLAALAERVRD